MKTLTIVCDRAPTQEQLAWLNEVSRKHDRPVELIDRHEFAARRGWRPNRSLNQPMLYVGGEGERSVWVSCAAEGYNIFDYLQSMSG